MAVKIFSVSQRYFQKICAISDQNLLRSGYLAYLLHSCDSNIAVQFTSCNTVNLVLSAVMLILETFPQNTSIYLSLKNKYWLFSCSGFLTLWKKRKMEAAYHKHPISKRRRFVFPLGRIKRITQFAYRKKKTLVSVKVGPESPAAGRITHHSVCTGTRSVLSILFCFLLY